MSNEIIYIKNRTFRCEQESTEHGLLADHELYIEAHEGNPAVPACAASVKCRLIDIRSFCSCSHTALQKLTSENATFSALYESIDMDSHEQNYRQYGFKYPYEPFIILEHVRISSGKTNLLHFRELISAIPHLYNQLYQIKASLLIYNEESFTCKIPAGLKKGSIQCPGGFRILRFKEACTEAWVDWNDGIFLNTHIYNN